MPPRSLCLNVFTTSLGNGSVNKEAEVVVREVEEKESGGEKARHDSIQEDCISTTASFSQSVATTNSSPITSTTISVPTGISGSADPFFNTALPTTCSTCTRPPPSGHALLRCSRCKRAYYCSKICQKQAWKGHKADCDPVSAPSPNSGMDTPDVSAPGSPAMMRDDQYDAMHDVVYGTSTSTH